MNIIKINKEEYELDNKTCKVEINTKRLLLTIKGNTCIYDYNKCKDLDLTIKLEDNSTLTYCMYSNEGFDTKTITIENTKNSKIDFNYAFISDKNSHVTIINNILNNNVTSNIRVRAVAKKEASIIIDSNGYVKEKTKNNIFNEDLRGLNLDDGMVKINPNMYIDSNEVVANHNATIGNINKDYLFYLNSKGITNLKAKKLIVNGFIKTILNDKFKI